MWHCDLLVLLEQVHLRWQRDNWILCEMQQIRRLFTYTLQVQGNQTRKPPSSCTQKHCRVACRDMQMVAHGTICVRSTRQNWTCDSSLFTWKCQGILPFGDVRLVHTFHTWRRDLPGHGSLCELTDGQHTSELLHHHCLCVQISRLAHFCNLCHHSCNLYHPCHDHHTEACWMSLQKCLEAPIVLQAWAETPLARS